MADKLFPLGDGVSFKRYKDMGDGTLAEVVSVRTKQTGPVQRIATVADSIGEPWIYLPGNSAAVTVPGTVRMGFASAFQTGTFWPGDKVKTSLCAVRNCNQMDATITAIDTVSRLWVEYTTTPSQEHAVTGTAYYIFTKCAKWGAGYLANACYLAGIPYTMPFDANISGGGSAQINEVLARNYTDCDLAIYSPGMNDVYLYNLTFAQIKAQDMANIAILSQAPRLIITTIPARNSTSASWTAAKFAIWRQVNEWRRQYAAQIGAYFHDWNAAELGGKTYCNPLSTSADPYNSGVNQTINADDIHPIGLGGTVMGNSIAPLLQSIFPATDYLPTSAVTTSADGYTLNNSMMSRTTGSNASGNATFKNLAGSGSVETADGFQILVQQGPSTIANLIVSAGVIPRTKAVHGDSLGNAQRIVIDNTANSGIAIVSFLSNQFAGQMVDGDTLEYGCCALYSALATPGSGNPLGLLGGGLRVLEQHLTAPTRYLDSLNLAPGNGLLPGHAIQLFDSQITRAVASAGTFNTMQAYFTVYIAANSSACIDIGRFLLRRKLSL